MRKNKSIDDLNKQDFLHHEHDSVFGNDIDERELTISSLSQSCNAHGIRSQYQHCQYREYKSAKSLLLKY